MSTDKHPEVASPEEDEMEACSEAAEVKAHEEEEQKEDASVTVNGMHSDAVMDARVIKTEAEETDDAERAVIVPKEEAEGDSEDGMEEGVDEDRTEEDNDEQRDEDGMNEPQDLSLVDYSRYEAASLPDGQTTGERPFHCTQCGASFTQKGNLLRHIKLHSGEKPFKCPMCSYACRRRDALSGHLRTHSVEKPFKCNHCSRSYKQRSSLDEHRERCHVYIQSKGPAERAEDSHTARSQMGSERALLLDRLASNVAKRKSSMPQKFTGDNGVCLDLSFNRELLHRSDIKDPPPGSPGPEGQLQTVLAGPDGDPPPTHRPYPIPLNRTDINPISLTNGHKMPLLGLPHGAQPPLGMDSFHNDASQMTQPVMYSLGHLLGGINHQNGVPHPHSQPFPLTPLEALRVMRADGESGAPPGAVYPCGHCRVLFLDYVMFTIHMGCHGFRDPLECNVCGHRSRDRYEFSSHIARGEHRLELK
ncbi:zinc finger protein Eos-like isoform X3 [Poecilia formosa]|uniref:zinc finger protein Eos-like isoform X3 n=1 Tax=Poecilia formosa TaxID=48698 RepID=UPI0007B798DC|nr:PREDICTED: zinc finger protein Eos-like isoform X3 [Poecilia formosa]